ncbi:MAG: glycosyltransferase, partial [Candidatus Electrothrix sp. AUS4]|nr:glycosyltransferase [Candidatus Electrothrix sp. AUS4]
MTSQQLVTILINNYNYDDFLTQAIESTLNQDYKNIEIIVVDDGSQDDSRSILTEYSHRIHPIFKQNGGQASAFNTGFEASGGEIICFLDADDTFMLNKVSRIVELFGKYPEAGWLFHELQYVTKDGSKMQIEVQRATEHLLLKDFRQSVKNVEQLPYFPATTGLAFRTELLRKILPMPEVFRISADFFLRLASICQTPGILCPENLGTHRQHGDNLYVL